LSRAAIRRFASQTRRDIWALLAVFGIYGLVVWPTLVWLGHDLIAKEISTLEGININRSTLIGRDFVNIWHAGYEAQVAGSDAVYDRDAYRASLKDRVGIGGIYAFSYPPHMLMMALPFGAIGYIPALLIWTVAGLALFWAAARPWLKEAGLPSWAVFLLPGAIVNLWAGHFGFLIGALALYGFWHAQDRPVRAGGAFALMTVKPHLGLLVPLVLLMKQKWRATIAAALGAMALGLASLFLFGAGAWQAWLGSTLSFQFTLVGGNQASEFIYMMPTIARAAEAMGVTAAPIQWGVAIAAIATLIRVHRQASARQLGLMSQVATFLILPYVFHYDMVILSLIALIVARQSRSRWYMPDRLICAAAFLVPLMQVPLAKAGYWPSPLIIAGLLGLMIWRIGVNQGETGGENVHDA
jgi:alpha-1,2-mannosyltransferase